MSEYQTKLTVNEAEALFASGVVFTIDIVRTVHQRRIQRRAKPMSIENKARIYGDTMPHPSDGTKTAHLKQVMRQEYGIDEANTHFRLHPMTDADYDASIKQSLDTARAINDRMALRVAEMGKRLAEYEDERNIKTSDIMVAMPDREAHRPEPIAQLWGRYTPEQVAKMFADSVVNDCDELFYTPDSDDEGLTQE